ncbi:tryptophan 7-halogenase, partial [Acinetobacter baumannii]
GDENAHATLGFGLSVDTQRLTTLLRTDALDRGVSLGGAWRGDAVLRDDGGVAALVTADGARVAADLVIAAAGADTAPGGAREDWRAWFPFD